MAKKTKTVATPEAPATIPIAEAKTKKVPAKAKTPAKKAKPAKDKRLSALDAAAKVLVESGQPMSSGELIEAMAKKNLWSSPNGQTPAATLYLPEPDSLRKNTRSKPLRKSLLSH